MLKKGTVVTTISDEYTIDQQIGQGGNGTVYRAHNLIGQSYALKAIDRGNTGQNKLKRFRNELQFCQSYEHKNVIHILDSGTHITQSESIIFYIMPLYAMTLRDKMSSGLQAGEILPIFFQLLEAVKFAHQKQVWHRDIKPENILIGADGTIVLADFGIAHFCDEEMVTAVETKQCERLANFTYAAPEQRVRNMNVDGHADVFALGLILNELFTGFVISGTNYKTIKSVFAEYGYLDDLVTLMVDQDQTNRLYPVERIALHIAAAQKDVNTNQELLSLIATPKENDNEFYEIPCPQIIHADYRDGTLFLYIKDLDYKNHMLWFEVLRGGNYSHSSVARYSPSELRFVGNDAIAISIPSRDAHLVNDIAKYIREWFVPATTSFNANQRAATEAKKREENRQNQEQIKVLKAEEAARSSLRGFLSV